MPFDDPFVRDGKPISPLDGARRRYLKTGNPAHAFRALQICGELMRADVFGCTSLPPWLLGWLMPALARIEEIFAGDVPESNLADAFADAFGVKAATAGKGRRTSAVSDWQQDARDLALASAVWRIKRADPMQRMRTIVAAVADDYHVSKGIVWDAWGKRKDFVTEPPTAKTDALDDAEIWNLRLQHD